MIKNIKIRIKKINVDAVIPQKQTKHSAGYDLYSNETTTIRINQTKLIHTGISVEIPEGFELQIRPRSGLALKQNITILNTTGTIDSDFRGEIGVILHNFGNKVFSITKKDRIAQMVLNEVFGINFMVVDTLNKTDRGSGGFGSTGSNNKLDITIKRDDKELVESINKFQVKNLKQEIKFWLDSMEIEDYTINEDLTVDVDGDVDLDNRNLIKIPIQFGIVKGNFDCSENQLKSLKGSPKECEIFDCSFNNLESLKGCPKIVKGDFLCIDNNLRSLNKHPEKCDEFYCYYNPNLTKEYLENFGFSFVKGNLYTDYDDIDEKWNK